MTEENSTDNIFAALADFFAAPAPAFYAYLDQHGHVIASGTQTNLEYAQQVEIDEASHKLCLEKGMDILEIKTLEDGRNILVIRELEVDKNKKLMYFNYTNKRAAVSIKVKGSSVSAKVTTAGLKELEQFSARGKILNKIWILDADRRHRCVAELKVGTDFIMDSVKLDHMPERLVAATYPIFSGYNFEIENGKI